MSSPSELLHNAATGMLQEYRRFTAADDESLEHSFEWLFWKSTIDTFVKNREQMEVNIPQNTRWLTTLALLAEHFWDQQQHPAARAESDGQVSSEEDEEAAPSRSTRSKKSAAPAVTVVTSTTAAKTALRTAGPANLETKLRECRLVQACQLLCLQQRDADLNEQVGNFVLELLTQTLMEVLLLRGGNTQETLVGALDVFFPGAKKTAKPKSKAWLQLENVDFRKLVGVEPLAQRRQQISAAVTGGGMDALIGMFPHQQLVNAFEAVIQWSMDGYEEDLEDTLLLAQQQPQEESQEMQLATQAPMDEEEEEEEGEEEQQVQHEEVDTTTLEPLFTEATQVEVVPPSSPPRGTQSSPVRRHLSSAAVDVVPPPAKQSRSMAQEIIYAMNKADFERILDRRDYEKKATPDPSSFSTAEAVRRVQEATENLRDPLPGIVGTSTQSEPSAMYSTNPQKRKLISEIRAGTRLSWSSQNLFDEEQQHQQQQSQFQTQRPAPLQHSVQRTPARHIGRQVPGFTPGADISFSMEDSGPELVGITHHHSVSPTHSHHRPMSNNQNRAPLVHNNGHMETEDHQVEQKARRRRNSPWTAQELAMLEEGVERFDRHWASILVHFGTGPGGFAQGRTQVDLKDKARNEAKRRQRLGQHLGAFVKMF